VKPDCEDEQEIIIAFNEMEKGKHLLAKPARNQPVLEGNKAAFSFMRMLSGVVLDL